MLSPSDPETTRLLGLLRDLGAQNIAHPGGDLYSHLVRVHELTVGWQAARPVELAALCHATYGTDGFPHPLLPVGHRERLREVVGRDAERVVYLYGSCDRSHLHPRLGSHPLSHRDRFTGGVADLDAAAATDLAVLTIANELDVVRFADLTGFAREGIRSLITGLGAYAPVEAASALDDPALA